MADEQLREALAHPDASVRLRVALAAGTRPDGPAVDPLVDRCAVEPDFFVRDMLTWALTRHPREATVPRLLEELRSPVPQARSQALHTLSKVGDPSTWPAVAGPLLHDEDEEVARSAWRAAIALLPAGAAAELATRLVRELGRGGIELRRSLSRALAALGDDARPAIDQAGAAGSAAIRTHAAATLRLLDDPEADFGAAIEEAKRVTLLTGAPIPPDPPEGTGSADVATHPGRPD